MTRPIPYTTFQKTHGQKWWASQWGSKWGTGKGMGAKCAWETNGQRQLAIQHRLIGKAGGFTHRREETISNLGEYKLEWATFLRITLKSPKVPRLFIGYSLVIHWLITYPGT